jgi:hypothetical protein
MTARRHDADPIHLLEVGGRSWCGGYHVSATVKPEKATCPACLVASKAGVTEQNPAARYGSVSARAFDAAADYAKAKLTVWLDDLPGLSDEDFFWKAATAIHDSAITNSWRGNWSAEDCKASAVYAEAQRRHMVAGHTTECTGDTIYSQAFAQVWREQGHDPSAYPPRPCDCGLDG